jgi:hypothetical protein
MSIVTQNCKEVEMKNSLRTVKQSVPNGVWCDRCCVRIAPYEPRIEKNGKLYHGECYSKSAGSEGEKSGAGTGTIEPDDDDGQSRVNRS